MTKKSISHVSMADIYEALGTDYSTHIPSTNKTTQADQPQTSYVSKLKDEEIINFFKPFGFISMVRPEPGLIEDFSMIQIFCEDFDLGLSDYDVVVSFEQFNKSPNPRNPFDLAAFKKYCEAIETTPEKALADIVQIGLLGQRFHSYQKKFAERKQKERKDAFDALPTQLKRHAQVLNEKREHEIDSMKNKLMYGDFSGDSQSKI